MDQGLATQPFRFPGPVPGHSCPAPHKQGQLSYPVLQILPYPVSKFWPHWLINCLQSLHSHMPFLCCCCCLHVLLLCVLYLTLGERNVNVVFVPVCLTLLSEGSSTMVCLSCHTASCTMLHHVSVRGQKCKELHDFLMLRRLYSQLASSALSQLYLTGVNINIRILWVDCCPSVLFLLTAILTFLNTHCCHCTHSF